MIANVYWALTYLGTVLSILHASSHVILTAAMRDKNYCDPDFIDEETEIIWLIGGSWQLRQQSLLSEPQYALIPFDK